MELEATPPEHRRRKSVIPRHVKLLQRCRDVRGTTETSGRQILDQVHADRATIWVERSSQAEFNKQGKLQRIVDMVVDITERKRAEEQLQVQLHRDLEVAYCRLVTISTDNIPETNEYRTGVGAHWPFLSDAGRIVQKDLDIAQYTGPAHNPTIPLVIVLEPGLVIYKLHNGYWFFGRPGRSPPRPACRKREMPAD